MSIKGKLLEELNKREGKPVSGQQLAEALGVSRNAVWKAIHALIQEGYPVASAGNRGYRLTDSSDLLSASVIRSWLPESCRSLKLKVYREVDSTNREAARLLGAGETGELLLVSDTQTAGRGHNGSSFPSPANKGIYCSFLLHAGLRPDQLENVFSGTAVAVLRAFSALQLPPLSIRGTDEFYLDRKKTGGILCEANSSDLESGLFDRLIIGIGLYLSLTTADGKKMCGRNRLIAEIASQIRQINYTDPKAFLREYNAAREP
ncbi:MAG: biotin operon repressor [Bilifractor porci]|jgi:BirA family biotin operon repressor/biotin-[acetyl-CoA-carboxylase] ligase